MSFRPLQIIVVCAPWMDNLESDDEVREVNCLKGYKFDNWGRALDQAWKLIGKEQVSIQELYDTFARYKFIVGSLFKDCEIEIL